MNSLKFGDRIRNSKNDNEGTVRVVLGPNNNLLGVIWDQTNNTGVSCVTFYDYEEACEKWGKVEDKVEEWPQYGDRYWYVETIGTIDHINWDDDDLDRARKDFDNCFRTEQAALAWRDKIKAMAKF